MYEATQFMGADDSDNSETDDETDLPPMQSETETPYIARLVVQPFPSNNSSSSSSSSSSQSGLQPGMEFGLRKGTNEIGRKEESEVTLDHTTVSRNHCKICLTYEPIDSSWTRTVEDLSSSNGTFLKLGDKDKYRVSTSPNKLLDQHIVYVGDVVLMFELLCPGQTRTPIPKPVITIENETEAELKISNEDDEDMNGTPEQSDTEEAFDPGATQAFGMDEPMDDDEKRQT